MDFVCIEKQIDNVQPTFMEIEVSGQTITQKIPVNIPLRIIFTGQTGQLTHECILFINKKPITGRKKVYQIEEGKKGKNGNN